MNSTNTVGLNADTPKFIAIDEGAVFANWGTASEKCLGAVSGANEFSCKIKTWSPSIGAISSNVKNLTFPETIEATLKCNFVEMTEDILQMALLASVDKTSNTDYDIITSKSQLTSSDYLDNIALVGEIQGSQKPVVIILKNVLIKDGIDIKREHAKTNTLVVTFTPHVDPATPHVVPFEIRYPKDILAYDALSFTSVPLNNATGVVATVKPVLTFNNKITEDGISLVKDSDSSNVVISKSYDATEEILTISPTASLTSGATYDILVSGVEDVYGQTLTSSVIKFTVA